MAAHNRSKNGVASLAIAVRRTASLRSPWPFEERRRFARHGRSKNGVASLAYGPGNLFRLAIQTGKIRKAQHECAAQARA
jgi:hypothetical protein